jgi:hypothetical protein
MYQQIVADEEDIEHINMLSPLTRKTDQDFPEENRYYELGCLKSTAVVAHTCRNRASWDEFVKDWNPE